MCLGIPYGRKLSVAARDGKMDIRAGFHASARWQRHVESSVGGEGGGGMRREGEDAALWWSGEMYAKVTRAKSISVITVIILGFVRHFPIIPRLSLLPHHQTLRVPHQTHSPHHHSLRAHHPGPAAHSPQSYIHDLTVHSPHTHLPNTLTDPHTGISVPSPFSPAYT